MILHLFAFWQFAGSYFLYFVSLLWVSNKKPSFLPSYYVLLFMCKIREYQVSQINIHKSNKTERVNFWLIFQYSCSCTRPNDKLQHGKVHKLQKLMADKKLHLESFIIFQYYEFFAASLKYLIWTINWNLWHVLCKSDFYWLVNYTAKWTKRPPNSLYAVFCNI